MLYSIMMRDLSINDKKYFFIVFENISTSAAQTVHEIKASINYLIFLPIHLQKD